MLWKITTIWYVIIMFFIILFWFVKWGIENWSIWRSSWTWWCPWWTYLTDYSDEYASWMAGEWWSYKCWKIDNSWPSIDISGINLEKKWINTYSWWKDFGFNPIKNLKINANDPSWIQEYNWIRVRIWNNNDYFDASKLPITFEDIDFCDPLDNCLSEWKNEIKVKVWDKALTRTNWTDFDRNTSIKTKEVWIDNSRPTFHIDSINPFEKKIENETTSSLPFDKKWKNISLNINIKVWDLYWETWNAAWTWSLCNITEIDGYDVTTWPSWKCWTSNISHNFTSSNLYSWNDAQSACNNIWTWWWSLPSNKNFQELWSKLNTIAWWHLPWYYNTEIWHVDKWVSGKRWSLDESWVRANTYWLTLLWWDSIYESLKNKKHQLSVICIKKNN